MNTYPKAFAMKRNINSPLLILTLLGINVFMVGSNSDVLLLANFKRDTVGQPPSQLQPTGEVFTDGLAGWVRVDTIPPSSIKWAHITRPVNNDNLVALQGVFNPVRGDGDYGIIAAITIPSGSQTVSFSLESPAAPPNVYGGFLHLDFLENNRVRIDDNEQTVFGSFPRDKSFVLSLVLHLNPGGPSADIMLTGNGAEGSLTYPIPIPYALIRQFQAARFWIGFPWVGQLYVTDFVITKHKK